MAKIVGIDLGTANTLMCLKGKPGFMQCPSVVAISKANREVVALGHKARNMLGKTPEGIITIRPMQEGVIADPDATAKMLRIFFEEAGVISFFSRPSVIASIPYGVTEVSKRALEEALFEAGARSVALIDEPMAAALGTGIRVGRARGNMIVDIGGGTTEVAVISLGGIATTNSLRTAGNRIDESIVKYLRVARGTLIGNTTAEDLKLKIGSAHPSFDIGEMEVCGRNLRNGLGSIIRVTSGEVREAMSENLEHIIRAINATLEQTPPELSSDIYDYGIVLTGGGAELFGIESLMSKVLGISVTKPQGAMDCVAKGLSRINAFIPTRAKVAGKNVTADLSRYYAASKKEKAE